MSRMRCMMPMEPVINTRTKQWQKENAMEEYLDSLVFLGMPLEETPESEAYPEPPSVVVKSQSMDVTTSDQTACSPAPQVRMPKGGRFFQRKELVRIGVLVPILALLLTIGVSL